MQEGALRQNLTAISELYHYPNGTQLLEQELSSTKSALQDLSNLRSDVHANLAIPLGNIVNVFGGFIMAYALVGMIGTTFKVRSSLLRARALALIEVSATQDVYTRYDN